MTRMQSLLMMITASAAIITSCSRKTVPAGELPSSTKDTVATKTATVKPAVDTARARFVADSIKKRKDFPNLIPITTFFDSKSQDHLYYVLADTPKKDTFLFRTKWEQQGGVLPRTAKLTIIDNPLGVMDTLQFEQDGLKYYYETKELDLQFDKTKRKVTEKTVQFYQKPIRFDDVGPETGPDYF